MTPEEEDYLTERHAYDVLFRLISGMNWQDTRCMVSILRAVQRVSLSLVASHPLRTVSRAAADAGTLRLMEVLTEWVAAQPLSEATTT